MGTLTNKPHKKGVITLEISGKLDSGDIEQIREALEKFLAENRDAGACGFLINVVNIEEMSVDALDSLIEILAEPEEIIGSTRTRFALIGVRPFTKRFLREAMPLENISHLRARFFDETAENEALAWLQAMVDSADELPAPAITKEAEPAQESKSSGKLLPRLKLSSTRTETPKPPAVKPQQAPVKDKAKPASTPERLTGDQDKLQDKVVQEKADSASDIGKPKDATPREKGSNTDEKPNIAGSQSTR